MINLRLIFYDNLGIDFIKLINIDKSKKYAYLSKLLLTCLSSHDFKHFY